MKFLELYFNLRKVISVLCRCGFASEIEKKIS